MFKFLATLLCLFTATAAFSAPPESRLASIQSRALTVDRTVMIDGVIAGAGLEAIGAQLLAWSVEKPMTPVNVIIDSPGGSVFAGTLFINQMEAVRKRGTPVRCFVTGMAASMAFSILLHCDERYALNNTYLLWHPVRAQPGPLTAREATVIGRAIQALDKWILRDLAKTLRIPQTKIRYHFYNESLHYGRELAEMAPGFMATADAFPGLLETAANPKLQRSVKPQLFFFGGSLSYFAPGTIVYMTDRTGG